MRDTIDVADGPPGPSSQAGDAGGFATSQKVKRTPPQPHAHPTPPGAPTRPTRENSKPADARNLDSGDKDKQGTKSMEAEKPASIIQALRTAKAKADALNPHGRNTSLKTEILSALDEAINMAVEQEHEHAETIPPQKCCSDGHNEGDIDDLRKEISDLKEAFRELQEVLKTITARPESFAQIVKSQEMDASKISLEMAKRERAEKNMKKREKMEVVLTLRNASKDVQQELESLKENAIAETLQGAMCDWLTTAGKKDAKIKRVEKISKNILKLHCATEEDAEVIRGLEWGAILNGAAISKKPRGVVMHGVSKRHINFETQSQDEIRAKINEENDIKVLHAMPLMKKAKNPDAPTQSIVILMEDPNEANHCIDNGVDFRIDNGVEIKKRNYHAERYVPECQVRQCYNCQGFGHTAFVCTKAPKCRRCAGDHESRKCNKDPKEPPLCINCGGPHNAGNHRECPRGQKERERQALRRDMTPTSFAC
jgi:hypothetical protein